MEILKHIIKSPLYIIEGIKYHLGGSLYNAKPRMIQFPVCDRCNSRCIMCNRWQKEIDREIELDKIREVFQGDLFSEVEFVGLHGGEPTLRKDLADICRIIQEACPKMTQLWISTNGFGSGRVEKRVLEILDVLDFKKLRTLDINVSIDGIGETHDKIRGIKGGFKQSMKTIEVLQRLAQKRPLKLSMSTVIQPLNIREFDELQRLGDKLGIPVYFQPVMSDTFFNVGREDDMNLSQDYVQEFDKLVRDRLARGCTSTSYYWCDFLSMKKGNRRKSPCAFDRYVFSLYPTGEVLPCSREDWIIYGNVYDEPADKIWFGDRAKKVKRRMRDKVCPGCSSYCGVEFSLQKEFFRYAGYYLRKKMLPASGDGKTGDKS